MQDEHFRQSCASDFPVMLYLAISSCMGQLFSQIPHALQPEETCNGCFSLPTVPAMVPMGQIEHQLLAL
jgi:hypothetical protein